MRTKVVAANWKMNGNLELIDSFIPQFLSNLKSKDDTKVIFCVPSVYLSYFGEKIKNSTVLLGAQNMYHKDSGAYTGEISPLMLKEVGCKYVILGHSERREIFKETDDLIAKKVKQSLNSDITPIFCVGESKDHRENNQTISVISKQLSAIIDTLTVSELAKIIIAYEPIWAIGTGLTATSDQAEEVHAHIRQEISKKDYNIGQQLSIMYGGSVKSANARDLFSMENIDGGLVGGASLDPIEFSKICNSAN